MIEFRSADRKRVFDNRKEYSREFVNNLFNI